MDGTSEVTKQAREDDILGIASEHDAQKDKYMTFRSGSEYFGIKIQYVNEIIQFQAITEVPETEDYIKGLINLRGKVIPVIDVRLRFNKESFEYNDRTCIIIISVNSTVVGLIVEQIAEVVEIQDENILPPPTTGRADKTQNKYVYGIGKVAGTVKLLLDPDKLINDMDLSTVENNMNNEEGEV